jgi:hypothetical protein
VDQAAAEAAKKAEEEAVAKVAKVKARKAKAPKKQKAAEVDSGSEPELGPSQKKGKSKVRVMSAGSVEEAEDACLR